MKMLLEDLRIKERRGLLDYDDLIDKTLHLLSEEQSAWVHYKLDLGIDHVLIDEAQDTNPEQWRVIVALTGSLAWSFTLPAAAVVGAVSCPNAAAGISASNEALPTSIVLR